MKNDWLVVRESNLSDKSANVNNKLLDIMYQIEDGRGWRFTDEQADTLAKLVDSLIEQVRAYNKKRNESRKRRSIPFFK